jgi:hypothetical protein
VKRFALALLVPLALLACDKKNDARSSGGPAPSTSGAEPEIGVNDGSFVVAAQPPASCATGAVCTVPVKLEAQGEFHINDEYPYKLIANAKSGAELQGSDPAGKNIFSKAAGDFAKTSEKVAIMNVKLKPTAKGRVDVSGTYKLSVCAESKCKIETAPVSFAVDVQ